MLVLAAADLAVAGDLWRTAEGAAGAHGLTCGWDWVRTWIGHYGDVVPHRFVIGMDGETPVAAALLTVTRTTLRRGLWTRALHVGTSGEPEGEGVFVERNRVLAGDDDTRRAFVAGLLADLGRRRDWDELRLPGFVALDAGAFQEAAPDLQLRPVDSPAMDLRAVREDGGDVVAALRSGPRSRIRRSLRGLGDVEAEWAATETRALAIFDELVEVHQRHWLAAGEPGAFASGRVVAFHRELIARLLPRDAAMLFRVRAGGETIGCVYGLRDGERMLFYQSGVAQSADPKVKPGLVTHALCMQECLERGYDAYDFLAGDDRYKRELSSGADRLVWGRLRRPRSRPVVADVARRALGRSPAPISPFE